MRVLAIDDDQSVLTVLAWILKRDGHQVTSSVDPAAAMRDLPSDVDLVISDVNMPEMDGFEVARLVTTRFGAAPPRTLLISGADHRARAEGVPPNQLIGLMDKPISMRHMHHILCLIEQSRAACPGIMLPSGCPARNGTNMPNDTRSHSLSRFCESETYARCPLYNDHGGRALRTAVRYPHETPPPPSSPAP